MQTIKVKVEDSRLDFFLGLLRKFNFNSDIKISNDRTQLNKEKIPNEIRKPKGKPSITDFSGIWANNPKTIEQIRTKAWKRS
jgi:folate-binding Fe-S cluster repair protein YgfZ